MDSLGGTRNALSHGNSHDSSIPRLDMDVPSPNLMTSELADRLRSHGGAVTPIGQAPTGHRPGSPLSPHQQAQRDWENAPDGGAAAAASLLSRDRNPRSGFALPSVTSSSGVRSPGLPGSGFPSPQIVADDVTSPTSYRSATVSPAMAQAWSAVTLPPPRIGGGPPSTASSSPRLAEAQLFPPSRPASALSSSATAAATNADEIGSPDLFSGPTSPAGGLDDTALPRFSRDKAKRERAANGPGSMAAVMGPARRRGSATEDGSARQSLRDLVGLGATRRKEKR